MDDGATALDMINPATGEVLVELQVDTCGPVALDHQGRWLAHSGEAGGIVVRDAASGTIRNHHDTGLSVVNALAFAPDGAGLLVAGATPDDAPAAVLLTLDGDRVVDIRPIRPEGLPPDLSGRSPLAAVSTRCVWGGHGPWSSPSTTAVRCCSTRRAVSCGPSPPGTCSPCSATPWASCCSTG